MGFSETLGREHILMVAVSVSASATISLTKGKWAA